MCVQVLLANAGYGAARELGARALEYCMLIGTRYRSSDSCFYCRWIRFSVHFVNYRRRSGLVIISRHLLGDAENLHLAVRHTVQGSAHFRPQTAFTVKPSCACMSVGVGNSVRVRVRTRVLGRTLLRRAGIAAGVLRALREGAAEKRVLLESGFSSARL